MKNHYEIRPQWSSATSYLLVTIGAVVGLGNIFQFPFFVAQYGGLFILFYILCELFISIPLFLGELFIGRAGKQNPVGSIGILCLSSNANPHWRKLGWLCFAISLLSAAYYMVSVAFPLSYLYGIINFLFHHKDFTHFMAIHGEMTYHFSLLEMSFFILLLATVVVVARGIHRGLEGISKITVPLYSLILFFLAIYTATRGNFFGSLLGLVSIHPHQAILPALFAAMIFAFFKLGVGMGTMIVYGSYLPYSITLKKSTAIIVLFDAFISLLSYFIIYPLTLESTNNPFTNNLTNSNVIYLFSEIPGGLLLAVFLFFATVVAAWTPTIAMAETVVVTLIERTKLSRLQASMAFGIVTMVIGSVCVLTKLQWAEKIIKYATSELLIPISAFAIALFLGWIITPLISSMELQFSTPVYRAWLFLVRYIAPLFIVVIFLGIVGAALLQ